MTKSQEITRKLKIILEHFINGDDVYSQKKGFKMWSKINEVGAYRHQWNTMEQNYKVVINGEVVAEVGVEFDDSRTDKEILADERRAIMEAKELMGLGDKKAWMHHCKEEGAMVFSEYGMPCKYCLEEFKPNLKLA